MGARGAVSRGASSGTGPARAAGESLVRWLKFEEGFRGRPYKDTNGFWTIGYGRNLDANPLTPEEGQFLMSQDLKEAAKTLRAVAPWADTLDEVRWSVLFAMAYQMGFKLATFTGTLAAVRRGDYAGAAHRMLQSKWAKVDSPARAQRSARMMESGQWPSEV